MSEKPLVFHPQAEVEALNSYRWYARRNVDAADAFQCELEQSRKMIEHAPDAWPAFVHGTRKFVLRHFPFKIVYRVRPDRIEVVAVAHNRRRPGYWADRLN